MSDFPANIINEVLASFTVQMADHMIFPRPLRTIDPHPCIGLFVIDWAPMENSKQIGQNEPALNRYTFRIQNMVKDYDEENGRRLFAVNAKIVRTILYRDVSLQARLQVLSEEFLGTLERFKRYGVVRQRFINNELGNEWVYLATTDFWVETESVKL